MRQVQETQEVKVQRWDFLSNLGVYIFRELAFSNKLSGEYPSRRQADQRILFFQVFAADF